MPPVLDPANSKVDGLAFLGLSLARNHQHGRRGLGHGDSVTHQRAFDLNDVVDRNYEYLASTDDSGWLVGGGEPGPPRSYKLTATDSAHVEVMRIGTFRKEWGGLDLQELLMTMASGVIRIPQIEVVPTAVEANEMTPPELELRFDMEDHSAEYPGAMTDFETFCHAPLPMNWQLRFVHNQLFKTFHFPSRFCPGPFHSTITRKAEFRSPTHRDQYFDKCDTAIQAWREAGPQPLTSRYPVVACTKFHANRHRETTNYDTSRLTPSIQTRNSRAFNTRGTVPPPLVVVDHDASGSSTAAVAEPTTTTAHEDPNEPTTTDGYQSGLWLFTDRATITHQFRPNFFPPYDTIAQRQLIFDVLQEEWDESSLSFVPYGHGSMRTTTTAVRPDTLNSK